MPAVKLIEQQIIEIRNELHGKRRTAQKPGKSQANASPGILSRNRTLTKYLGSALDINSKVVLCTWRLIRGRNDKLANDLEVIGFEGREAL